MELVLVHLSDLHFRSQAAANPILGRTKAIGSAVSAIAPEASACFLVVSGDIAFSGKPEEYIHAKRFLDDLAGQLRQIYASAPLHVLAVPGNHDCDFARENAARKALLASVTPESETDASIVALCTCLQQPCFDFLNAHTSLAEARWTPDCLAKRRHFCVGTLTISFLLLNSAWCSQHDERPGSLLLQASAVRDASQSPPSTLSFAVMHHAFAWLHPSSARPLQSALEQSCDFVLTGHDHWPSSYRKVTDFGQDNRYFEGGVLQSADAADSSFHVVALDMDACAYTVHTLQWTAAGNYTDRTAPAHPLPKNPARLGSTLYFSDEFTEAIRDPGANYTHPRKHTLTLSDLYVFPALREIHHDPIEKPASLISGKDQFHTYLRDNPHLFIIGADKSGKTALVKTLCSQLQESSHHPLLIDASRLDSLSPKRLRKHLDATVIRTYGSTGVEGFWQADKASRAALVDNYDQLIAGAPARADLLRELRARFGSVIVIGGDEIHYDELERFSDPESPFSEFRHLQLLPFGYVLRHQLVEKWYMLGRPSHDTSVCHNDILNTEKLITQMLGQDLLPSHPVFLLIVLQTLETANQPSSMAGSTGYLYEVLITTCLAHTCPTAMELDSRHNYLSELAYHLFASEIDSMSDDEAAAWHAQYQQQYHLTFEYRDMRDTLIHAGLLSHRDGHVEFKYKYIFCYCVGRYLRDHLGEPDIMREVAALSKRLYHEDSANIIVFLCHLSKEPRIIDHVLTTANSLFPQSPLCDFATDLEFIRSLATEAPRLALPAGDPEARRIEQLRKRDQAATHAVARDSAAPDSPVPDDDAEALNRGAEINAGFKTIQVLGQILRNFYGSLKAPRKLELANACFSLAFRELHSLYEVLTSDTQGIISAITDELQRQHPDMLPEVARLRGGKQLFMLTEFLTLSMIKHVSDSVGMHELARTFADAFRDKATTPYQLLQLAIKLDHYHAFPLNEVTSIAKAARKDPFALCLLRHLVWLHLYLFPVDYRMKQKVCATLDIGTSPQKFLDKRVKRQRRLRG